MKHYRQHLRFLGKPIRGLHRAVNRSLSSVAHHARQADNFLKQSRLGRVIRDEVAREVRQGGTQILDRQLDRLSNVLR